MDTLRTWQLAPGIRRIWHDPSGAFERLPDPALGDWGRSQRDTSTAESLAGLEGLEGLVPVVPMAVERDAGGRVRIAFPLAPGEHLYGAYDADAVGLDRRGDHVHLFSDLHPRGAHATARRCKRCKRAMAERTDADDHELDWRDEESNYGELLVPLVISSRGYAVYVSNLTADAIIDLGTAADPDHWTFEADGGDADIYVLGPGSIPELVRTWTRLSGLAPLPPAWTLGFIQSRFGYESFEHALRTVRRFGEERLPVHGLVFDVQWLEDHVNLRWDPTHFPRPEEHLAEIAAAGVRSIVITEPGTREDASNYAAGREADAFATVDDDRAPDAVADREIYDSNQWYADRGIPGYRELRPTRGALLNVFRESAADWWYDQHLPLLEQGVDAWWLDLNEPEDVGADVSFRDIDWPAPRPVLDGRDAHNIFAITQQRLFARRDREHSTRRPFMLSRCGSAGSQRYGAAPWSGDIGATWQSMRTQLHLGLTAGLCGIPLWGCDIGGFHGDPGPELFARWMQLGAFLPVFRAHGSMRDREPWSQGEEAMEAMRPALVLRAQLLPSLVTWAREALAAGEPLMRPMFWDHPGDERLADVSDQWHLGPLLVAPVLHEGVTSRRVLLPHGAWVDLWSGTRHVVDDGELLELDVPVTATSVPVFIPASVALVVDADPLAGRGHAWPPPELEVWSFAGDDGESSAPLYVDDGITREHEQGAYCELRVDVRDGEVEVERLAGAWPTPRLRSVAPHPGVVPVAAGAGA